ncbi:MFS transporter [Amycolatopsis alkalitolerans]|uniref:Multidrug efflux MFS transporter n=1 Tax=Amycolatopsis alkalitolerans TaxID=2547244 RepID=A0A5C4LVQ7_9PSEU|nr:MFS transporter [Amycolatopsis alkalitolerans]TNC23435.1 multidrug efflux MFS transporter [Amycolatopsis alkalitolerans]
MTAVLPTRLRLPALGISLTATTLATIANNVVNVPLPEITGDFGVPLPSGVLAVTAFVLVLAATIPLAGWVGDRFGRRRVLTAALTLMTAGLLGAALAPTFAVLVACRAVQGLACAAVPATVMGTLANGRAGAMGAWAAANGIGQAAGPPLGGLVSELLGWRAIFWLLAAVTALAAAGTGFLLPAGTPKRDPLHWPGALLLTTGAALVMLAPQIPAGWAAAVLGAVFLTVFVLVSNRSSHPLVAPKTLAEPRFLRSAFAVFAQMFCLGAVLVAVPLYVTGSLGYSTGLTGLIVFALPASLAVSAPLVGLLSDRTSPRRLLRAGLLALACVMVGVGAYLQASGQSLVVLAMLGVLTGAGIALVQTTSATGATRSPAGRAGAALGLFNLVRFAGSAFGAAWVAASYPDGVLLFGGCAVVALCGLGLSFAGPDPALR